MYVLGISCFYHDAAAALVGDGELIAAAEEERFSRRKHDHSFPRLAIEFCLSKAGISARDLDLVVFYEKPFRKFDRIVMSAMDTWPHSATAFREAMLVWLLDKLWVRDILHERVGCERERIVFCPHHMSHAASAFYPSDFPQAAVMTVDGVGEWACATRGWGRGLELQIEDEMRYPHSLGLLYSAFTAFLGFQVNEGEYKVMGMAPYGHPVYTDMILEKMVHLREDGSFKLNMDYFAYHHSAYHSFTGKFTGLLGRPRTPAESNLLDPHYADVAASIQEVAEIILVRQAQYLQRKTGHENLCLAGGTALNSAANFRIFKEAGFKNLYIQPAAGDGGGALGAALWGYFHELGGTKRFHLKHAYWGQEYSDSEIADFLKAGGYEYKELPDMEAVYDEAALRLENSQVVGWMHGRFEWGPRALGARSILADPRSSFMKDVVNARIKFREPFRPFAPSALVEGVQEYFELDDPANVDPARFMLMVLPVREEKKTVIPAVTHVDGTSRIQAVHREECPVYHGVISRFKERTGVPLVLNTSFNLRGEPIVNTPEQAYSTFARSDMDALIMGRFLVSRREAGEGRLTPGAELEKWAHAPQRTTGTEARPEAPKGAVALQVGSNGAWGGDIARDGSAQGRRGLGAVMGRMLLVLLMVLLALEVLLRLCWPNVNMQMRGIYKQTEQGISLRENWHGRIHNNEFSVNVQLGPTGRWELPPVKEGTDLLPGHGSTILALGDSFTFGCWSEPEKNWLTGIQNATGAKVINMGLPNAGTFTALKLLQNDPPRADIWMLSFYTGNDYYDNLLGTDAYELDAGGLVLKPEVESKWGSYDCLQPALGTGPDAPSHVTPFLRSLLRRTYLYQTLMGLAYRDDKVLRLADSQAWFLKEYTAEMTVALQRTYTALDQINALAQAKGVQLVLVIIPSQLEINDAAWQEYLYKSQHSADLFDRLKPGYLLMDWADNNGVPCYSLRHDLVFRQPLYYRTDMHWNDLGHFQAGEKVSQFLVRESVFYAPQNAEERHREDDFTFRDEFGNTPFSPEIPGGGGSEPNGGGPDSGDM